MPSRQTRVVTVDPAHPDPALIAEAAARLRAGHLVAFPTETVYGLGAHALDAEAVRRIFVAKGRPSTDPLIVHVRDVGDLPALVREVSPLAAALAARFWPGPLTLILPKRREVPDEVTAGLDTVAIRVPAHPVARALLEAAALPVAAPSANLFSRPSPTRAAHVLADLEGRVDLVIDAGPTSVGLESTVLDLTTGSPLVRRPGGVPLEALRALVPDVRLLQRMETETAAQVSPGQLLRHYAPRAPMTLVDGPPEAARALVADACAARRAAGLVVGILAPEEDVFELRRRLEDLQPGLVFRVYGSRQDPERSARELFEAIRDIDAAGVDTLLAIAPGTGGIGLAIRDRLLRASEGRVLAPGPGQAPAT